MKRIYYSILLVLVSVSFAGQLLDPANLRVSSYYDSNSRPLYAINGAGLASGLDNHTMTNNQTMWRTAFAPGNWAGWFEVDFGEICDLSTMVLYNYNDKSTEIDATDAGVGPFQILVSDNGVDYFAAGGVRVAAKSPDKDRVPPIHDTGCPPQSFPLGISARFVKLKILDNWGFRHTTNGVVGLSELRFFGTPTGLGANIPHTECTVIASSTSRGDVDFLVDGTGLLAGTYGGHDWHHGGGLGETGWSGNKDAEGKVNLIFNFNNPTNLAAVQIWNLSMWFGGGEASRNFRLLVKQSGQSEYIEVVNDVLNENAGVVDYDYSQMFAINTTNVSSAKLIVDSTWYEYASTAALSEVHFIEMPQRADPFVNLEEVEVMARYWQMSGCDITQPCVEADWYYDGVINMLDLQQLAANWLK